MAFDPLDLSKQLLAFPSVTPKDAGVVDWLTSILSPQGFACHPLTFHQEGTEEVKNLYARLGTGQPHFCFAGHTDVVPPGNPADWKSDPFKPEVRDGVLYARGTSDMKCAIACFIAAALQYVEEHGQPKGSIGLLITGDEEGPSINGTKKMLGWLKEKGESIDACIVGEPTNPDILGEMAKIGRRGSMDFVLTVFGTQGHVAYPHLADNPITRLVAILHTLKSKALDQGNAFFQPSNLEVSNIEVNNSAGNVIPAQAKAYFNIRFNNEHQAKDLESWVRQVCGADGTRYELAVRVGGEAFLTKPGPLSELVVKAIKDVTGRTPDLSTTGGTSDARFIKDVCPVVEFGLTNKTAHKVDECASVEDIYQLTAIYKRILEGFFQN